MPADPKHHHSNWASRLLLPAFEPPHSLDIYDVRDAPFDVILSAATISGLVNRQRARIYLLSDVDAAPLREVLLRHIPAQHHAVQATDAAGMLIEAYRSCVRGLIIYDPSMIDSVNVATTLAGLRDAVVVSPQQADQLKPHKLPLLADLRIYGWKNRLQAYRWAARYLLKECSPRLIAGMRPTIPSGLRSYLVANRAFVYWLDPHLALPDPASNWTTQRSLMKRILHSYAPATPHLGWFADEARGVNMASKAALPVLPSDYFYNMEVWSSGDMASEEMAGANAGVPGASANNPGCLAISPRIYVSFTISDGDNLQFNQHRQYHLWQDPARGSIPIGWTISPLLLKAAPALAEYYMHTATPHDELIAGASGAGYVLPSRLPHRQLPAYLQLTGALMQRMHMTVVEVLDRPRMWGMAWQKAYAKTLAPFGLRGILSGDASKQSNWRIVDGVPVIQNLGLTDSVGMAIDLINRNTPAHVTRPHYLSIYIHAWNMTPSDVKIVIQSLDSRYEVVSPGTLLAMIASPPR